MARHGDLVDLGLSRVGDPTNPEGAVESQLEAVEVGHATEAQEDRLTPPHDARRGPVMGFGDFLSRRHDLKEMGVG